MRSEEFCITKSSGKTVVVGALRDGWLRKEGVDPESGMVHIPEDMWALDEDHVQRLDELGAKGILILEARPSRRAWRLTMAEWHEAEVFLRDYGYGKQRAVPLRSWHRCDNTEDAVEWNRNRGVQAKLL